MPYQRKYDFQPGTKISSNQVDEEFNNLIKAANDVEAATNNVAKRAEALELENSRYNPSFFCDVGAIGQLNPSELRQIPITSANVIFNKFFTIGTYEMVATESGLYFLHAQANWSGMNPGIQSDLVIRRVRITGTYSDYVFPWTGAQGQGSNTGGFHAVASAIFDCNVGDKFHFFARHFDVGVRNVDNTRIQCFKVSEL